MNLTTVCRVLWLLVLTLAGVCLAGEPARRVAWISAPEKPEDRTRLLNVAKTLRFTTLIVKMANKDLHAFAVEAKAQGLEVLYWHSVECSDNDPLCQVMSADDEKQYALQKQWKNPTEQQYQWGGEPVAGRQEVLFMRLRCHHRPETLTWAKQDIARVLKDCPEVAGVAFDYYGYQNYRDCRCPVSTAQLAAYRTAHPALSEDQAGKAFALESLAAAINELAGYVREKWPAAKTAIHVYPVFLPEPLYGKRLDLDYCCQSVAWYFPPYWSDDQIRTLARRVVREQNEYHARQQGIPFVGVGEKPAARLAAEVHLVKSATNSARLSCFPFNDIAAKPELQQAFTPAASAADAKSGDGGPAQP